MEHSIWALLDCVSSTVVTVLQRDYFTFDDVISHESVIQDLKYGREEVIRYFQQPQILQQMLSYVTKAEPRYPKKKADPEPTPEGIATHAADSSATEKFPYTCTEVISNSAQLADVIMSNDELLLQFFDFLKNNPPPLNPSCTGYFRRVCTALLTHDNQKLIDTVVNHNIIPHLIAHIDSYSIMELIIMTGWDDGLRQFANPVWIQTSGLLSSLLDALDHQWVLPKSVQQALANGDLTPEHVQTYRHDVASHAGRVLIDLIIKCPESDAIQWLLSKENINRLISFALHPSEATAGGAISLLILLSQHVLTAFQNETSNQLQYQIYIDGQQKGETNTNPQQFLASYPTGLGKGTNHGKIGKDGSSAQHLRYYFKPFGEESPNSTTPSAVEPIYQHDYTIDCGQPGCKHVHVQTGKIPKHVITLEQYSQFFSVQRQQFYLLNSTRQNHDTETDVDNRDDEEERVHIEVIASEAAKDEIKNANASFDSLYPYIPSKTESHSDEIQFLDYRAWSSAHGSVIRLPSHYIIDACRAKLPAFLDGIKPTEPIPTHIHPYVSYGQACTVLPGQPVDPQRAVRDAELAKSSESVCNCDQIKIFGDIRMKQVELVSILLSESDSSILPILLETNALNSLVELFLYYPWHTLLHSMVETVIYYIGRSVYTCHSYYLFTHTKFLQICQQLFQLNLVYVQHTLTQGLCLDINLSRQMYDVSLYLQQKTDSSQQLTEHPYEDNSTPNLTAVSYSALLIKKGEQMTSPQFPLQYTSISNYSVALVEQIHQHPYYHHFSLHQLRVNQCRAGCIAFVHRIIANVHNIITDEVFLSHLDPQVANQLQQTYRYIVDMYCILPPSHVYYKQMNEKASRDVDDEDDEYGFRTMTKQRLGSFVDSSDSSDDDQNSGFGSLHPSRQMAFNDDDYALTGSNIHFGDDGHDNDQDDVAPVDPDDDDGDGFLKPDDAHVWY